MTVFQRDAVMRMLAQGIDRHSIAREVGVTPGQVSAVAAHLTMGTYEAQTPSDSSETQHVPVHPAPVADQSRLTPIFVGVGLTGNEDVYWNPDPATGAANPHVLVLGESGFGKTYAISALLAELARQEVVSIIFDYGQGFALDAAPPEFVARAKPVEVEASRHGIDLNPLRIFPSDLHGPVNVAQRVADTFTRVYTKLGVQQHAVLRQAVLDAMADEGILPNAQQTWSLRLPPFNRLHEKLATYAADPSSPQGRIAASVASHISTMFVFNTFRSGGLQLSWADMMRTRSGVYVLQLTGLEYSLERAVTEFLLWNLVGYIESLGPGPLRCFVVLDEAHRLSFEPGSPVEKLLREGRKFGLGLILASQQPADFSTVAFGNTATKMVFQVGDDGFTISRQIHRKLRNPPPLPELSRTITTLPRGNTFFISENNGRVVRIVSFADREKRWNSDRGEAASEKRI